MASLVWQWRAAIVAATLLVFPGPDRAEARYTMCALRAGPEGPCTCKTETDGPGQFTTVAKSHCRRTPPAASAKEEAAKPASPSAAIEAPATAPPAPADANALSEPASAAAESATKNDAQSPSASPPPASAPLAVPAGKPKLAEVRARGWLNCGVSTGVLGFSQRDAAGTWTGMDAEFCRAVAAAVFADASKVEFVPLEAAERFDALRSNKIDLLSRTTTWTMDRDVSLGIDFAGILYFDGQSFMVSDERGLTSAQQLAGLSVCVEAGTTSERNMAYYFSTHKVEAEVKTFPAREALLKAYGEGACEAYTGDRSTLFSERAGMSEPLRHAVLPEVISKEPLGPAVAEGDRQWLEIVRWTLAALVNAEEAGLTKAVLSGTGDPPEDARRLLDGAGEAGAKLELNKTWVRDVVAATGHYGEIFDQSLGKASPLGMDRGLNALWKRGGLLYAPPMW